METLTKNDKILITNTCNVRLPKNRSRYTVHFLFFCSFLFHAHDSHIFAILCVDGGIIHLVGSTIINCRRPTKVSNYGILINCSLITQLFKKSGVPRIICWVLYIYSIVCVGRFCSAPGEKFWNLKCLMQEHHFGGNKFQVHAFVVSGCYYCHKWCCGCCWKYRESKYRANCYCDHAVILTWHAKPDVTHDLCARADVLTDAPDVRSHQPT